MTFPSYISTKNRTTEVLGYLDKNSDTTVVNGTSYMSNKGYIDENGYVWIFSGIGKPVRTNEYPYFWMENDEKKFSDPSGDIMEEYHERNLKDISVGNITAITKEGEVLFNEEELNDMNAAAEIYVPVEKAGDDFLKKIIKRAIIEKQIDISRIRSKTGGKKYVLSNMKSALEGKTKMSVIYFILWCELLSIDFTVSAYDNGNDPINPLDREIVYSSAQDRILSEEELKGVN